MEIPLVRPAPPDESRSCRIRNGTEVGPSVIATDVRKLRECCMAKATFTRVRESAVWGDRQRLLFGGHSCASQVLATPAHCKFDAPPSAPSAPLVATGDPPVPGAPPAAAIENCVVVPFIWVGAVPV